MLICSILKFFFQLESILDKQSSGNWCDIFFSEGFDGLLSDNNSAKAIPCWVNDCWLIREFATKFRIRSFSRTAWASSWVLWPRACTTCSLVSFSVPRSTKPNAWAMFNGDTQAFPAVVCKSFKANLNSYPRSTGVHVKRFEALKANSSWIPTLTFFEKYFLTLLKLNRKKDWATRTEAVY